MAGDVYGSPPYVGRGGWSWYTGSAAWLYRAALESLLGLSIRQGQLSLNPCVPAHWPSFDITLQLAESQGQVIHVRWQRADVPVNDSLYADTVVTMIAPGEEVSMSSLTERALVVVRALVES